MDWAGLRRWTRGVVCSLVVVAAAATAAAEPPSETSVSASAPTGGELSDVSADAERAVLYTIGPGTTLFERWGHSLLCFQPVSAFSEKGALPNPETPNAEALVDTSCFDFGVFPRNSLITTVLGTLRGEPLFVPLEMAYQNAVGRYWWLDRTVERQVLPLSPDQVFDLRDRLNEVVLLESAYSYHPFDNNCSSQLRDVIDEFAGGVLSRDAKQRNGPTLRDFAEKGFSGQLFALAGLEVLIGSAADEKTSSWERAAFPQGLKGLVLRRWGITSQLVYQQTWAPLPTSIHAGRGFLLFVSLGLCASLLFTQRREGVGSARWRKSVGAVCGLVSAVGAITLLLRLASAYPEFSSNWGPLVFFPLDAALPWMRARVRRYYLAGRLAVIGGLMALSLLHVISQPLTTLGLFVAMPLALIGLLEFRSQTAGSAVVTSTPELTRATEGT